MDPAQRFEIAGRRPGVGSLVTLAGQDGDDPYSDQDESDGEVHRKAGPPPAR
jgi:hypothetical protein